MFMMPAGTGNAEASITLHYVVVPPGILTIAKITSFLVRARSIELSHSDAQNEFLMCLRVAFQKLTSNERCARSCRR